MANHYQRANGTIFCMKVPGLGPLLYQSDASKQYRIPVAHQRSNLGDLVWFPHRSELVTRDALRSIPWDWTQIERHMQENISNKTMKSIGSLFLVQSKARWITFSRSHDRYKVDRATIRSWQSYICIDKFGLRAQPILQSIFLNRVSIWMDIFERWRWWIHSSRVRNYRFRFGSTSCYWEHLH